MASRPESQEAAQPQRRRVRRSAADRRAEIVDAATRIALRDGLESVTLRSIGEELDVAGSLINHYFDSVDYLLAEAFGAAARAELTSVFEDSAPAGDPLTTLAQVLGHIVGEDRAEMNLLWIDAWHVGRRRPALKLEVVRQSDAWTDSLADLIEEGVDRGQFKAAEPRIVAAQIMAVLDGLTVQSTLRGTIGYDSVALLGFSVAESQLGLAEGALTPESVE